MPCPDRAGVLEGVPRTWRGEDSKPTGLPWAKAGVKELGTVGRIPITHPFRVDFFILKTWISVTERSWGRRTDS